MDLIDKIKSWYASQKEAMKDRKIIRRGDYLSDRLTELKWYIERNGQKGYLLFSEEYSKLEDEQISLRNLYSDAMTREGSRMFASFSKRFPRENYLEKTA